jgi:hypothetical protein
VVALVPLVWVHVFCEHAIGNQAFDPNAIRSTSHKQIELTASKRKTSTPNRQSRCRRVRQDEKTESRLGSSR